MYMPCGLFPLQYRLHTHTLCVYSSTGSTESTDRHVVYLLLIAKYYYYISLRKGLVFILMICC